MQSNFYGKNRQKEVSKSIRMMKSCKVVGPRDIPILEHITREVEIRRLARLFNRIFNIRKFRVCRDNIVVHVQKKKCDIQSCRIIKK